MAKYSFGTETGGTPQALVATSTYKTLAALTAATASLRRAWIYDVMFGTTGTPGDHALTFIVDRQTTAIGTATTAVPIALDASDAAAGGAARVNHTAEPTQTANSQLLGLGINQRASYRWVAAPGGELVVPATDLAGLGLRAKSATSTTTCTGMFHFFE